MDKNALPLSERKPWPEDPDGAIGMFKCWPYTIVDTKPKNKDEREDSAQWEVCLFSKPLHDYVLLPDTPVHEMCF